MATNHPTIHGVAAKAGVSPTTVSRVLNAPSLVKSDKRRRILAAIEELQFVPKAEAVAKARRQLKRIAVIAPFFTEPSFMERLKGINSVLSDRHYELVIYAVHRSAELEGYIDMLVPGKRVDGLISLCLSLGERILSKLQASSIPLCCVEKDAEGFDSVVITTRKGKCWQLIRCTSSAIAYPVSSVKPVPVPTPPGPPKNGWMRMKTSFPTKGFSLYSTGPIVSSPQAIPWQSEP